MNLEHCTLSCVKYNVVSVYRVLDESKCESQIFSFQNVLVREMVESHSDLRLVIRLYCV